MAEIIGASIVVAKSVDKSVAYVNDTLKYSISLSNVGNSKAERVVIKDTIPATTTYVADSLKVNVPYTGDLAAGVVLTNPIEPKDIVVITFEIDIKEIPNPNPVSNKANINYTYIHPTSLDEVSITAISNSVITFIPRYNFGQQITDIIESIALEEAALAGIVSAEASKIEIIVSKEGVTKEELLAVNKSVSSTLDSISLLESILKQKLSTLNCQLNPYS